MCICGASEAVRREAAQARRCRKIGFQLGCSGMASPRSFLKKAPHRTASPAVPPGGAAGRRGAARRGARMTSRGNELGLSNMVHVREGFSGFVIHL